MTDTRIINTSYERYLLALGTTQNDNSSTTHQFSCCVHRLKRSGKTSHSPGSQPGTLGAASGADDAVDV